MYFHFCCVFPFLFFVQVDENHFLIQQVRIPTQPGSIRKIIQIALNAGQFYVNSEDHEFGGSCRYLCTGLQNIETYLTEKEIERLSEYITDEDVQRITKLASKIFWKSAADMKKVVIKPPYDPLSH